ncbi:hypothetical protein SAMN04488513_107175 [Pseudozobellia thermophila]|uniref:Uncharacterized protein n=1 Tax=Pseudozobellia thermophila TaxID=192903 RepID=A0A1M6LIM2_9FLAO|nr:hypothetical protein SAMN04488513_107175 [Pseudozobellia thermophila]
MDNFGLYLPILAIPACSLYLITLFLRARKVKLNRNERLFAVLVSFLLLWNIYEFYRDYRLIMQGISDMLG